MLKNQLTKFVKVLSYCGVAFTSVFVIASIDSIVSTIDKRKTQKTEFEFYQILKKDIENLQEEVYDLALDSKKLESDVELLRFTKDYDLT